MSLRDTLAGAREEVAQSGNPYYHSYATCSGMTNATQGILVNALAAGLTRCPVCWTEGNGT